MLHISWKSVETPILIPYFPFMFSLISLPVLVGALGGPRTLAVLLPYSPSVKGGHFSYLKSAPNALFLDEFLYSFSLFFYFSSWKRDLEFLKITLRWQQKKTDAYREASVQRNGLEVAKGVSVVDTYFKRSSISVIEKTFIVGRRLGSSIGSEQARSCRRSSSRCAPVSGSL